jgi:hypothetical protein
MADPTKMMFSRPKNCQYCGNGYYALQHMLEYAQSKAKWTIIDAAAENAVKEHIFPALLEHDPESFFGFGHGSNTVFTGDTTQPIFTSLDCSNLANRYTFLLSCLTANGLGPAIIQAGGKAYAGYNISWTWLNYSDVNGDPYLDKYAKCFWESANEFWRAFIDGASFPEAMQASIAKYNWWIDYWLNTNPNDAQSESCIMWLVSDRDSLVTVIAGGEFPPEQTAQLSPIVIYSAIALGAVGIMWYLMKIPKSKPKRA